MINRRFSFNFLIFLLILIQNYAIVQFELNNVVNIANFDFEIYFDVFTIFSLMQNAIKTFEKIDNVYMSNVVDNVDNIIIKKIDDESTIVFINNQKTKTFITFFNEIFVTSLN